MGAQVTVNLLVTYATKLEFSMPYTVNRALGSALTKLPPQPIPRLLLWMCPSMRIKKS